MLNLKSTDFIVQWKYFNQINSVFLLVNIHISAIFISLLEFYALAKKETVVAFAFGI